MNQIVELGEVCEFLDNQRIPVESSLRKSGKYPYYGANGLQDWVEGYIFDEPLVLLAEDGGHFGSKIQPIAYKITGKSWVNNHAHVLRAKSNCDIDYLCYILSFYDVTKLISGTTRPKLTKGNAERITFPLPSLSEQQRIAAILGKADRLRFLRHHSHVLSDTYLQSVFLEMFGDPETNPRLWKRTTIDDISLLVTDGEHLTPCRTSSGIKLLSARNIQNGFIDFEAGVDYISNDEFKRIKKRCNPEYEDVLISCSGSVGRVTTVAITEQFSLVRSVALIKPDRREINPYYLEHFLRTNYSQEMIKKYSKASSQPNLFQGPIKELPVLVPPVFEQRKFVDVVKKYSFLRSKQFESERQAEHLFQALSRQAFHGEL
jgi:type I restriction enzyme S subunit